MTSAVINQQKVFVIWFFNIYLHIKLLVTDFTSLTEIYVLVPLMQQMVAKFYMCITLTVMMSKST